MSDKDEGGEKCPVLVVAEALEELVNEKKLKKNLSEESFEKFKKVSSVLSSVLPPVSDPTILEIDDLLYRESHTVAESLSEIHTNEAAYPIHDCFNQYNEIYRHSILTNQKADRILDTTYLQFIEYCPSELLDKAYGYITMTVCLDNFLGSRCHLNICRAMKILRIGLMGKERTFKDLMKHPLYRRKSLRIAMFLSKLKRIPQARQPDKQRIAAWIRSQAGILSEKFDVSSFERKNPTHDYIEFYISEQEIDFDESYLKMLLKSTYYELKDEYGLNNLMTKEGITYHLEHLHAYLNSAQDNDGRLLLLQSLFKHWNDDSHLKPSSVLPVIKCPVMEGCDVFVRHFYYYLKYLLERVKYSNDVLNEIDKHYHRYFELNVTEESIKPTEVVVEEPNGQRLNEDKCDADNNKETSAVPDYTFEQFLVYDEFMKSLEVMRILYTACSKKTTLRDVPICHQRDCTERFRKAYKYPIKNWVIEVLVDNSKLNEIPWFVKKTVLKCPFMVLAERYSYLKDDLVKLFKGEKPDEVAEERLYLLINAGRYKLDLWEKSLE